MLIMLMRDLVIMSHNFIPWIKIINFNWFGIVSFELNLNGSCLITNIRMSDGFFIENEHI